MVTKFKNELAKVLRALPEKERAHVEGAFKLGWDAAISAASIQMFDSDYNIERPLVVLKYGRHLRDELLKLHSWEVTQPKDYAE